jgi:hypothetical protein
MFKGKKLSILDRGKTGKEWRILRLFPVFGVYWGFSGA